MKILAAVALLLALGACSGGADGTSDTADGSSKLSATEAFDQTCAEVRAGIDDFNRDEYADTVEHFRKAEVTAKIHAEMNTDTSAADLLDAVTYYAELAPEDYPDAARGSADFARNKAITLGQCASNEPIDADPPTEV